MKWKQRKYERRVNGSNWLCMCLCGLSAWRSVQKWPNLTEWVRKESMPKIELSFCPLSTLHRQRCVLQFAIEINRECSIWSYLENWMRRRSENVCYFYSKRVYRNSDWIQLFFFRVAWPFTHTQRHQKAAKNTSSDRMCIYFGIRSSWCDFGQCSYELRRIGDFRCAFFSAYLAYTCPLCSPRQASLISSIAIENWVVWTFWFNQG